MIFISYRKDDSSDLSWSLAGKLNEHFGEGSVFLDRHQIEPGDHWREEIDGALSRAAVVLAVIGPHWLTSYDEYGQRRIDRDDDVLAYELSLALQRGIVIIPLYLHGLKPFPARAFPARLAGLAGEQGIEFDIIRDLAGLCAKLEKIPGVRKQDSSPGLKKDASPSIPKELFHDLVRPLNFEAESKKHLAHFTGRKWVEDKLDEWIPGQRDSKVFCLLGGPGIGKSAIACHWCHTRNDVIAFHHCIHDNSEKTDPKRILLSLAAQIAARSPEYEKRLRALGVDELKETVAGDKSKVFDKLLQQPLSGDFPIPDRVQLVVLDGLDEAGSGLENELSSFLGQVWGWLPDWLRLVVTARPEMDVKRYLGSLHPFILHASSRENLQDIHTFLQRELDGLKASDQVINEVVEKSEGMFLYACLVLADIRSGRLSLQQTAEFPEGLTGYYWDWFKRKFPNVEIYQWELHPLVSVIIAQRAPLPLSVLSSALGLGSYDLQMRLMKLGVLFPLREERQGSQKVTCVTLMHKSLHDWLTEPNPEGLRPRAGPFAADPELGNRLLASEGWKIYSAGKLGQHPYFSRTLLSHLSQAQKTKELAMILLDPALVDTLWSKECRDEWQRHMSGLRHNLSLAALVQDWLQDHGSAYPGTPHHAVVAGKLCRLFQEMGAFDEAILFAEAALRIWQANNVTDSPDMVGTLLALGKIDSVRERLRRATVSYEKALTIAQRAYAPESQQMADVLYALSVFYTEGKRDYPKASDCLEKCFAIRRRGNPPDLLGMATCINDRAVILTAQGKSADCLGIYREALSLFETVRPDGHPEMVATLGNIANELRKEDKTREAVEVFRRAVTMAEHVLLPQHEYSSSSRIGLASALLSLGQYDEALEVMRAHVAELEKFPGPDHDDTAAARLLLCQTLCQVVHLSDSSHRGDYREEVRGQCQQIRQAESTTVLGLLVLAEKARRMAEPGLQDGLQEAARRICCSNAERSGSNPSDSVSTKCFCEVLEALTSSQPLPESAPRILLLWEAAKSQIEHEADCLPRTRRLIVNLISWAGRTRLVRDGDVASIHQAFDLITQIGAETPETLDHLAGLTVSLHHRHYEEISESLCRRLLEMSENVLGVEHIQTLTYIENLAHLSIHRGKLEEAERLYRRAFQGRLNSGGREQSNTLATLASLVGCVLLRGSTEAAQTMIHEFVPQLPAADTFGCARMILARCLSETGIQLKNEFSAFSASKSCYELSLEIDPDNAPTHNHFALLLWLCLHDAPAAAGHFQTSLALVPASGNTHSNYAHLLAQALNDPEPARAHFEEAMALSPNDVHTPANYAALLLQQGDLAKAWSLSERSRRLCLPAPDRMMARPLFCAAAILLLQGHDASVPLGQMKALFAQGIDHVTWDITALLEVLVQKLPRDSFQLMRAISDAISDKQRLGNLESDPMWVTIKPVSFDNPWPEPHLLHR